MNINNKQICTHVALLFRRPRCKGNNKGSWANLLLHRPRARAAHAEQGKLVFCRIRRMPLQRQQRRRHLFAAETTALAVGAAARGGGAQHAKDLCHGSCASVQSLSAGLGSSKIYVFYHV